MKMRPGVLTDTSGVKPWPTEGGVDLLSGYSLLLFLMYINKCLCKLGPLEEMFAWGEVSEIILHLPQGCMFQDPDNFLTIL